MKKLILLAGAIALVVGSVADLDARPRRPKKPVDHYTFSPDWLQEKLEPYQDSYDRVVLLNEFGTQVAEGEPFCRLLWTGRRVDAFLDDDISNITFEIPLPRGAELDDIEIYLVEPDGEKGKKVKKPAAEVQGDSLLVVEVEDLGKARVVDLKYRFQGQGVTVDEVFVLQPDWPALRSEYRFNVSRELWQDAVDMGMMWEFNAVTQPRTWPPAQDDSPEYYTWYWRLTNVDPVDPESMFRVPRSVQVSGFLPAPVLAGFDVDELPNFESLEDVMAFENSIQITQEDRGRARATPASGGISGSNSVRPGDIPTSGGGKGR